MIDPPMLPVRTKQGSGLGLFKYVWVRVRINQGRLGLV